MTSSKNGRASFPSSAGAPLAIPYSLKHGESQNFDSTPPSHGAAAFTVVDPAYLSIQLKSSDWLQRYGLKSQKLTFDQILQQIGVKRVESFNGSVGKRIDAKYADGLNQEIQNDNGDRFILTCRPEKLREFRNRLGRMLNLLQKRLTFLTSGSRRVFGLIGDPSVCLVCDCKTSDQRIFNQFQLAIKSLLKEQVAKIRRFNIIWVSYDNEIFQKQPIDVTSTTIDEAVDWISNRKYARNKISISATCEAVLKALTNTVHSIYLISEGTSSDAAREILRDNIVKTRLSSNTPIPIHVISLFCQNTDTEVFLRSIAQSADGGFFSYKIKNEIINLKTPSNLMDPTQIKLQNKKLQSGTNISLTNFEHPIDISLMYKEINECQNIIDRLEKILGSIRDENEKPTQTTATTKSLDVFHTSNKLNNTNNLQRSLIIQSSALFNNDENDMASIDWLKIYGVQAQKLDFFSAIHSVSLQHCDAVGTAYKSNSKDKFINTKYCDQFAHVTWTDGTIRHVYVTPELHRDYERRIRSLIEKIKAQLSWLKKGSRDVFGTILEKNVYILIDASKSMENHLNFLKDKLRLLIREQLFCKERINMASFNSTINPWRDTLTKVNASTTSELQTWIDALYAEGSTNTLGAIRFALADSDTQGIYLLTDGRPDQNERHILSQIEYRQVIPIHTIAFNCQDQTANQFLFDLAKKTGGRFHAFNYGLEKSSSIEIPESEDISYLKQEIINGEKNLQRVADLRDECISRTWSHENIQNQYKASQLTVLPISSELKIQSTLDTTFRPSSSTMPQRIDRRKHSSGNLNRQQKSKSATQSFEQTNRISFNCDELLLPESEDYLGVNNKKQKSISTIETDEEDQVVVIKQKPNPFKQVKNYLRKNSLVSKGLTILDVLRPTTVTIKEPLHIQVIDRYVLSKVWDDILPFTYGSYVNKFRLVNHYAVNLEKYEEKLKDLITEYHQFTSKFIWKCLNDEDKQKLGPKIYWISLSKENQHKYAQEITKEDGEDEKALELFAWRKLTTNERTDFLQKPVIYNEKTQNILKIALTNAEAESALEGVELMDVEIKRAIKFLQISNDLRRYQKGADNESKQQPIVKPKPQKKRRTIGQRVLCRYDGDGYFYIGTIQRNYDGRLIVLFDIEIEQEIIGHAILPFNLNNQLKLFLQDCVLVQQLRATEEYWVPGLVIALPSPFALPPNLYKIQIYDPFPKHIYVHRKDMIRINFTLFQRSISYLQNINRPFVPYTPRDDPKQSLSENEIEAILQKLILPLTNKVDNMSRLHDERYIELLRALADQMAAIRILQEGSYKSSVKHEYGQTTTPRSSSTGTRSRTPTPSPPSRKGSQKSSKIIEPGTKVYAVWFDDDGLVYEGIVIESIDSDIYIIERVDLPGVQSNISYEDIFIDSTFTRLKHVDENSFALIKYPNDSRNCFCPSVILRHYHQESETKVRFYDCHDEDIPNHEYIIPIKKEQFERYSRIRIEKEKSLINQVIVGLNSEEKSFMLGTIIDRVGTGHTYQIQWFDESINKQKEEHLFGAFTRRDQHYKNSYVLAMDSNDGIYKPAITKAISNDKRNLKVQFINENKNQENSSPRIIEVQASTTFVITKTYLDTIMKLHDKGQLFFFNATISIFKKE